VRSGAGVFAARAVESDKGEALLVVATVVLVTSANGEMK
jgi:hypothetical protein